jgi:plastocyanin
MNRTFLLSFLLVLVSFTAFSKVWTVGNSGNTFSPSAITIKSGDTVNFVIEGNHNAVEVSQATWNANGNTSLIGGFGTPFGGGEVLPTKLSVGTHYYVCTPHASMGMKGTITVQSVTTGISDNQLLTGISIFPNPSGGKFRLTVNGWTNSDNARVEIYNLAGKTVYLSYLTNSQYDIDLSSQGKGVYLLKVKQGTAVQTRKIVVQ